MIESLAKFVSTRLTHLVSRTKDPVIPIECITTSDFQTWLAQQSAFTKNWLKESNFQADANSYCLIPQKTGGLSCVLACIDVANQPTTLFAKLAEVLPAKTYQLQGKGILQNKDFIEQACFAFGLQRYQFLNYKKNNHKIGAKLLLPKSIVNEHLFHKLQAIFWVRDLINIPACDMHPEQLAKEIKKLARLFGAKCTDIHGEALLKKNFPAIYAVGQASSQPPRLLELTWGDATHPTLSLIGKGVCFDSGGLNIKPGNGMRLMKKDMGGAAHVLGLAYLIMAFDLPIHLQVLIPAVENVVSGNAFKPGDVIATRKGISVEIGNTDAEGRLVLADAITKASEQKPTLIIDFATLTGAARVALGTDIPVLFSNRDDLAKQIVELSFQLNDPIWQLPIYRPYRSLLNSYIADINNVGNDSYGGAIIAALFLQEFLMSDIPWLHLDLMAWNLRTTLLHPEGGEAMGLMTCFEWLKKFFS